MLLSPALLKDVIKASGRLAANPGPSPGPLGPAKAGVRTLDEESYTQQSGGLGVSVQIGPKGAEGKEMGTNQSRARPAAATGEPARERCRRSGSRSPRSPRSP